MKLLKNREDSLEAGLSFCLILGAFCGSLFCNAMSGDMKQKLTASGQSIVTASMLLEVDLWELFARVLIKRLQVLMLAFLISFTPAAIPLFLILSGLFGFSVSVMVCTLTMESGLWAIWKYALFIFPQCLFYLPVLYLLVWWLPVKNKRLTTVSMTALTVIVFLGAAAESFVNPWFLAFLT